MTGRPVRRYGPDALLVDLPGPAAVPGYAAAVRASGVAAETVPGWASVLVRLAPGTDPGAAARLLGTLVATTADDGPSRDAGERTVEVDVVYDGPDLPAVAAFTGLAVEEVVARHSAVTYTVVLLGFSRGFPYLDGTPPPLDRVGRLATPRTRVPAGSLAVAAGQTGIYPADSPGGWHLLGRTDAVLFDPARTPPALLAPGDRVRLRPC